MIIRDETAGDEAGIRAVLVAAFPTPAEADLVEALRRDGDTVSSLVAEAGGTIVGHALFSRMAAPFRALGLGPVAVSPARQRTGVGSRLIEAGLTRAAADGYDAVFVLGDPAYYRRFGFDPALAEGFSSPYAGPHFMVTSLGDAPLPAIRGTVAYAPAFAALG